MNLRYFLLYLSFSISFLSSSAQSFIIKDSLIVDSLNKAGYDLRLKDPENTLIFGQKALAISKKAGYKSGIAEAYRISGIGYYYLGKNDRAISNYLASLSSFKEAKNLTGEAKVYNNIGNLYKEINYDKALEYFNKALNLASGLNLPDITAGNYLNIGIINFRKKEYNTALIHTKKSFNLFSKLNNPVGVTLALQNLGVIYNSINQKEKAIKLLLEANKRAKESDLNSTIASIDLTLVSVYIDFNNFSQAEHFLKEGEHYAFLSKDNKLQGDFLLRNYELERKRKNYKQALSYLQKLYTKDSVELQNTLTKKFGLFEEQSRFAAREKESAVKLEKANTNRVIFAASIVVSALALVLILILMLNVKKKAQNNKELKILNEEISLQKENLNLVNQNLEVIIDERTKDLKVKNRKLAEYSSHLSHQIRAPIATMKGLIILEKEDLIEEKEFVTEMTKCVNEIDDKIININDVLHNLQMPGLIPKSVDKEEKS